METIVAIVLAGIAIAYVGYPLFKTTTEEALEPVLEDTRLDEVLSQKESTYSAIAELDFDHAMGNLSDSDYQELRDRLKLKALTLMKEADQLEQEEEAPAPMVPEERPQGKAVKAPARAQSGQERAAAPARAPAGHRAFCSSCGVKISPADKFCATCGSPAKQQAGCPRCGAENDPDDAFCANCGHELAK